MGRFGDEPGAAERALHLVLHPRVDSARAETVRALLRGRAPDHPVWELGERPGDHRNVA